MTFVFHCDFDKVEDYYPYIELGLSPGAAYAAPQSWHNGKGVTLQEGIVLLKLGFQRMHPPGVKQAFWVGPIALQHWDAWQPAPWPSRNDPRVKAALGEV